MTTSRLDTDGIPLPEEGRILARRLFGVELTDEAATRYEAALQVLPLEHSSHLKEVLNSELDVEAIEYALRRRAKWLTQRLHVLLYLLEFHPEFYRRTVNDRNCPITAWFALACAGFRAVILRLKGEYLIRRHRLV